MIDISDFNYDELIALERNIRKRKKEYTEDQIEKYSQYEEDLYYLLEKRFPSPEYYKYNFSRKINKELVSQPAEELFFRLFQDIHDICDIATENYVVMKHEDKTSKRDKSTYTVRGNGSIVRCHSEDYKAMQKAIFDIVMKYGTKINREMGYSE